MAPRSGRKGGKGKVETAKAAPEKTQELPSTANGTAGQPEHSERSGTQVMAGQASSQADGDENGDPILKFSDRSSVQHFAACAASANDAAFLTVCAGAVAFLAGYFIPNRGKVGRDEVRSALMAIVSERNIRKTMAYDYIAQGLRLSTWLWKHHKLGGAVGDVLQANDAQAATAMVAAYWKTKGVGTFNSLRRAIGAEADWTEAKQAEYLASQTKEAKAKALVARKAKARREAIAVVAAVKPDTVAKAMTKAGTPAIELVRAAAGQIMTPSEAAECLTLLQERFNALQATIGNMPQGENTGANTGANKSHLN